MESRPEELPFPDNFLAEFFNRFHWGSLDEGKDVLVVWLSMNQPVELEQSLADAVYALQVKNQAPGSAKIMSLDRLDDAAVDTIIRQGTIVLPIALYIDNQTGDNRWDIGNVWRFLNQNNAEAMKRVLQKRAHKFAQNSIPADQPPETILGQSQD